MQKSMSLLIAAGLLGSLALGGEPRKVGWGDLTVKVEFEDPFEKLSEEQLMKLGILARVRMLKTRGKASEGMLKEAKEAEAFLKKEKVDIEGLFAKRKEIKQLRMKRATACNPALDKTRIRMPGYALPLEYAGKRVSEFLLVPWVGACIHTPPPPPNQIVHVKFPEGVLVKSRFQPVWVTGKMGIGEFKKNLFLVDGTADIHVGYSLQADAIEEYKAKTPKDSAGTGIGKPVPKGKPHG